jgi:hypothetical protein
MAEINFVDGTALTPSTFGETKDGVWIPKAISGVTYGANGFRVDFADSNYIGRDKSGSKTLVTSPSFSTFGGGDTNFTQANYDRAFDNNLTTSSCDRTGSGGIIEITPSSSVTPVSHTMINTNSSGYTAASRPNSVLLQGSNDNGGSWTTIDDLTNGSGANTITTSSFSNTTSYAKLRLNISENHGGSNTRFGEYIVIASENNGDGENIFFNANLAASDVVPDSPTGKNFAVMNPLMIGDGRVHSSASYSEGNLNVAGGGFTTSTIGGGYSTIAIPKDKKIYIEVCETAMDGTYWAAGILIDNHVQASNQVAGDGSIAAYNRSAMINGVEINYGASAGLGGLGVAKMSAGDVLGVAVDGATGKVWFHLNGTYFKSPTTNNSGTTGNPSAGTNEIGTVNNTASNNPSGEIFFFINNHQSSDNCRVNFGQDSTFAGSKSAGSETDANGEGLFQYAVPTDYVCLHSGNMSDITIGPAQSSQADDNFNTVLWSGDGSSSRGITGVGFQPDWVWIKTRNQTNEHSLFDSVRGAAKDLEANDTDAEQANNVNGYINSFDSDGFTVVDGSSGGALVNYSSGGTTNTYVSWNWKAGGSASSNSNGSITSNVSANTDAGFSIGTYTGNATAGATIGHGLGAIPEVVIAKRRDNARDWSVYHHNLTSTPTNAYILLNSTAGTGLGATAWNNGTFTDDVFTIGSHELVNHSGDSYVFYAFKGIEGFSKFGSYIGNNSTNGPFSFTGFRPAWLMLKRTDSAASWLIYDNKRDTFNQMQYPLFADLANAEYTSNLLHVDFLSNGFKIRNATYGETNASGGTYIYLAFAEAPFKFANAR